MKPLDVLCIATCAVIAGAEGWEDIAEYGRSKEAFFRQFLELKNGVPSSVALVCRDRRVKGKENESAGHYYLSSPRVGAAELAGYIRRHWHIEAMHWALDVAFREDESRTEAGHAGQPRDGPAGGPVPAQAGRDQGQRPTRRLRAAWDDQYLVQLPQ